MGFAFKFVLALVVAALLGLWSAFWAIDEVSQQSAARNGAWSINTEIGSKAAGPYTRAMIARRGLLALDKSEAIYFTAETDDSGEPLSGGCTYVIVGSDIPAAWWTITAYGADYFLMDNAANKFSVFGPSIISEDKTFEVTTTPSDNKDLSATQIPVRAGEPFSLTLRLYLPNAAVVEDPSSFSAPSITKGSCS